MRRHVILTPALLVLSLAVVLAGCSSGDRVPTSLAEVPRIRAPELRDLIDSDDTQVVVVDTRSLDSFEQGHIPGAISLPTEETEARYGELDQSATIVTYCT